MDSRHKGTVMRSFDVVIVVSPGQIVEQTDEMPVIWIFDAHVMSLWLSWNVSKDNTCQATSILRCNNIEHISRHLACYK